LQGGSRWDTLQQRDALRAVLRAQGYTNGVPHTLLLHHSLLNALFIADLIDALQKEGFRIIAPKTAYADPVFALDPPSLPAGESLIWALANSDARLRTGLRYPAEDVVYEAEILSRP
jgi:peptidoglycan-N-acetylglucosamine deacetylase